VAFLGKMKIAKKFLKYGIIVVAYIELTLIQ
jgi:hypothetical protein